MRIDAHQHFWKYNEVRDSWITDDMAVIQRNFLPEDFKPLLNDNKIDGSIIVQSDQSKEENIFQLANALQNEFVKGVVGWIDLQSDNVSENLEYYKEFKKLKGFRHVLQGERQRDFMLRPNFKRGIGKLREFGYTYDILIFPDQLESKSFSWKYLSRLHSHLPTINYVHPVLFSLADRPNWKYSIERKRNLHFR